ncbi:phage tail spike protein [Clostridium perfringens]|nr:phage tail spike protein [Clostridium perfringens]
MIELRDKDKNRVAGLVDYENLCIESVLDSGDKTLSFYYPKKGKYYDEIVEESYIRTKKDEFVVKARELDEDYTKFECSLNLEELEGNIFDRFESVEQTITSALNLAIVGTGWTVKDNTLKKRRTVRCTNKSSLEIVREIKKVYRVDIVFNTLGKQIEIYEHLGEDKGTYFIDSLNLIALQVQSDSRQYATRIIAEGKDGLSFSDINNGKNYVENYQYSNKVKTIYWKDERYSVKENLLEDARAKLEELSKPFRSYSASILNLAELNPRYSSILDFKLGDAINLISKKNKIRDKQRIVKTIEWPQDHTKDSVELANANLKFEDIQQENQETTDTVSNITTDNGTINGSTIDSIQVKQIENFEANVLKVTKLEVIEASINHLSVIKADIQDLNVVKANIGILEATKANITELNSVRADLQQAIIGKANITDLNAAVGKIHVLESKTASIENALAGNLTAENFKANSIVAGSGIIAEGAIGSAQISSLSVNKLEAGDITTSKHRIVSADGTIEIVGNQILINRNNINRVILGEYRKSDGTTEYGLLVRAKDGQTIMLDGNGVHNAGITDGAIDNNKVADNANISGNKLDINSVIREVNNNGTETIKGTKVTVGDRTLDVELSTQNNTITEHSKELSSQKASLTALDNALKFKVDSQTFTQSTTTINNNINRAKEEAINSSNSHADSKANEALNNAKAFVNSEITNVNTHLNKNTSEINILKGQIESKVSQSDIDKSIQNIKFNDVNMILNSGEFKDTDHWSCTNGSNNLTIENSILKFKFTNYANWGCYISNDSLRNKPLETSKEYTVVCRLKASRNQTLSFNICDGNSNNHVYARDLNITTEWKIFKFTFKPASIGNERQFRFITGNLGYDFDFYIEFVKMVEGATSSDSWSMAPDYVLDNIKTVTDKITTVESKLTQENNSIKASVQDLNSTTQTITTNVSNINRDLTSKINSNLDAAKSFATDIAIAKANLAKEQAIANADGKITAEEQKRIQQAQDNLNAAISKATEAEIKAKSYADVKKQEAINSANNNTANTINNLDIGIYNLANESGNFLDNTGFFVANGGTLEIDSSNTFREYNTLKIKGNSGACYKDYIELQGNTTYCYSCWIKSDRIIPLNVSTPLHMWVTESKEDDVCHREIILKYSKEINSNWQQVFIIFKTPSNKDKYIMKPFIYGIGEATVWLANFQVKKGSILNDWTPNPNDLKRYSEEVAKAKAELAKQQAIANADGKITEEERKRIQQAQENLNVAIARADKAKQEAINSANSHADSKANEALNNAKAYTNAEITTVNSKVHNVESNLNILSDRINTKVSQSDIDKAVTTLRIERIIYARGTGNDYPANSIVKVNGKTITDGQGRGLRINALNKITLERVFLEDYDTYGDGNAINNFANKINELNNGDYIIIVTSQDASYPLNSTVKNALEKIGATLFDNKQGTYREAYALIGKSKLGRGNGIEMFIPRTETDKRFAEVSVKVGEDGTFIGVNSNNMGLEATSIKSNISDVSSSVTQLRDSVTTDIRAINSKTQSIETTLNGKASKQEVTEVNNRVATIKASLDSITQRVSSTESKTQTLESNINGKASKQEIVSINNKVASIETSLSGITNRVSSTESKTSSLEVSINSTNSELNILKNSISTKLEKIDSHIKYGSTNLLINTEFLNNFYNWNKNQYVGLDKYQEKDYVGVMIQNNRIGTEGTLWQRATLKTEVTYTLSFEEYTDDISRWWVGIYYKLNGATKYITLFDSSVNKHSWQKRVFQFKLPSGATETDVSFYNYGGSVGRVWVCNLQLEEGEFATPYKSNPLDFSKFSSAITQTVEGINTEVSKKVNGRDIISTINQSAESVKINASRINLQGYVTVGDLGSTNVTTINNAHITSGTIEGRTMIALNGTGKQNGVLTVNNGESYLEYFRCREAWMMSPYANGWRVPLVHSKYGIKDNESSSDMIDEIAFYRGTDGRNYLQITNTKTGRVEYIELYRSAFDTVTILNRLDRIDAKLARL